MKKDELFVGALIAGLTAGLMGFGLVDFDALLVGFAIGALTAVAVLWAHTIQ